MDEQNSPPEHMRQLGWAGFGPEEEFWQCTVCKKERIVDDFERHKHPCWDGCIHEEALTEYTASE